MALACGGKAEDTTIIEPPPPPVEEFDVAASATLAELAEPETREAFCGWLGATAAGLTEGAGAGLDCEQVTRQCRDAVAAAPAGEAPAIPMGLLGLPDDLEGLVGCSASLSVVDACAAELLSLVVTRYPEGPACDDPMPNLAFEFSDLVALESCVGLLLQCPDLFEQLLALGG